jgi:hypothetical protein
MSDLRNPSGIIKLGPLPIAIATKGRPIQTYRNDECFRQLFGRLMYHSRSAGIKCAKPSERDIEAVRCAITDGLELTEKYCDSVIENDELIDSLINMLQCADHSQGRVLLGLEVLLQCTDPDSDVIKLSPEIEEALWLHRRFGLLISLMNAVKFRPWKW